MRRDPPCIDPDPEAPFLDTPSDAAATDWLTTGRMFFRAREAGAEAPAILPATFRATEVDASTVEIVSMAHFHGVPPAALIAIAEHEGDRRRHHVIANASRLRRGIDTGAALSDILYPAVLVRIAEIERGS